MTTEAAAPGWVKKRSGLMAGLFNAVAPGLGFIYLGRVRWGLAVWPVLLMALALSAWTHLLFAPAGFLAVNFLILGAQLWSVVLAVQIARRQPPVPLRRIQRWYVYVAWFALSSLFGNFLLESRGALLGYDLFSSPSVSMDSTLLTGDQFVSNTWKYRDTPPQRREVVVFHPPHDPSIKYVMRVVGLPGDIVEVRPGRVRVNGVLQREPYVKPQNNEGLAIGNGELVVPANSYFVLGDNRDNSHDSRLLGPIPAANVVGSAEFIWLSWDANDGLRTERIGQWVK
jgi:signal peptidase I